MVTFNDICEAVTYCMDHVSTTVARPVSLWLLLPHAWGEACIPPSDPRLALRLLGRRVMFGEELHNASDSPGGASIEVRLGDETPDIVIGLSSDEEWWVVRFAPGWFTEAAGPSWPLRSRSSRGDG